MVMIIAKVESFMSLGFNLNINLNIPSTKATNYQRFIDAWRSFVKSIKQQWITRFLPWGRAGRGHGCFQLTDF
jgi:hypothetical protein